MALEAQHAYARSDTSQHRECRRLTRDGQYTGIRCEDISERRTLTLQHQRAGTDPERLQQRRRSAYKTERARIWRLDGQDGHGRLFASQNECAGRNRDPVLKRLRVPNEREVASRNRDRCLQRRGVAEQ
jgi:hypothetical protein